MKVYGIGVLSDRLKVGSGLEEFLSERIRRQESGERMRTRREGDDPKTEEKVELTFPSALKASTSAGRGGRGGLGPA